MAWNCAFKALTYNNFQPRIPSSPKYFIQQVEGEKNLYHTHTGWGRDWGIDKNKANTAESTRRILEARAAEKNQTH